MDDLVYRYDATGPQPHADTAFHWIDRPWQLPRHLGVLRRRFGWRALLRLAAVVATPSRAFFFVEHAGVPASHGRATFGHCGHYPIEHDAAVLGEIWSDPEHRGQRLATRSLQGAIRRLTAAGVHRVYIDTQPENLPMQRVIDRCGFTPVPTLRAAGA